VVVDGHSVEELCKVLNQPRHQPLAIIAKTIKGKGISGERIKRTPTARRRFPKALHVSIETTTYRSLPNTQPHISYKPANQMQALRPAVRQGQGGDLIG
jgi:deoxyxylulose-5-phosphate synthase